MGDRHVIELFLDSFLRITKVKRRLDPSSSYNFPIINPLFCQKMNSIWTNDEILTDEFYDQIPAV